MNRELFIYERTQFPFAAYHGGHRFWTAPWANNMLYFSERKQAIQEMGALSPYAQEKHCVRTKNCHFLREKALLKHFTGLGVLNIEPQDK